MILNIFTIRRKNIRQLFILYCCVLFYVVFLTPNRYEGRSFAANLVPFVSNIKRIHVQGREHFWRYYIGYWGNIFGNIILFMPFSLLIKYLYPQKNFKIILFYGLCTSISIEICQMLLQIGVCDIDDVILNMIGLIAGLVLYKRVTSKHKQKRMELN